MNGLIGELNSLAESDYQANRERGYQGTRNQFATLWWGAFFEQMAQAGPDMGEGAEAQAAQASKKQTHGRVDRQPYRI